MESVKQEIHFRFDGVLSKRLHLWESKNGSGGGWWSWTRTRWWEKANMGWDGCFCLFWGDQVFCMIVDFLRRVSGKFRLVRGATWGGEKALRGQGILQSHSGSNIVEMHVMSLSRGQWSLEMILFSPKKIAEALLPFCSSPRLLSEVKSNIFIDQLCGEDKERQQDPMSCTCRSICS